jgi:hypothetical protein
VPYIHLIVIVLLLVEARWRLAWLRVLLVGFLLFDLGMSTSLTPALREALPNPQRLYLPSPPSDARILATDYQSGVLAMYTEARRVLARVALPSCLLAWLAISPLLLDRWLPTLLSAWRRGRAPREG